MLELLHRGEESWWYKGRAYVVALILSRVLKEKITRSLDFGAGYGGMYELLHAIGDQVDAFEPDQVTQRILQTRGYKNIYGTAEAALVGPYDVFAMFDVLEHIEDDAAFVQRMKEAIAPSGRAVITVPAYQWLWSVHDTENHHFRRYTKHSLVQLLEQGGYVIEYAGYWNMLLFIPAALVRLLGRSGGGTLVMPSYVDSLLLIVVKIEGILIRLFSLPFGLSIVVVAHKR